MKVFLNILEHNKNLKDKIDIYEIDLVKKVIYKNMKKNSNLHKKSLDVEGI